MLGKSVVVVEPPCAWPCNHRKSGARLAKSFQVADRFSGALRVATVFSVAFHNPSGPHRIVKLAARQLVLVEKDVRCVC